MNPNPYKSPQDSAELADSLPAWMEFDIRELLDNGEQIVWAGRPCALRQPLGAASAITVLLTLATATALALAHQPYAYAAIACTGTLVPAALLLGLYVVSRRTAYVLTRRRAIVAAFLLGDGCEVRTYHPEDLKWCITVWGRSWCSSLCLGPFLGAPNARALDVLASQCLAPALADRIRSCDPAVRRRAAVALAELPPSTPVPLSQLADALNDQDEVVCLHTIFAVAKLRLPLCRELRKLRLHESPRIADAASEAFSRLKCQ